MRRQNSLFPFGQVVRDGAARAGVPTLPWRRLLRASASVVHAHDGKAALVAPLLAARGHPSLVRNQHFVRPASVNRRGSGGPAQSSLTAFNPSFSTGTVCLRGGSGCRRRASRDTYCRGRRDTARDRLPDQKIVDAARMRRQEGQISIVVSAGRLEHERRFDVLLRAIPRVRQSFFHMPVRDRWPGAAEVELRRLEGELGIGHQSRGRVGCLGSTRYWPMATST